jgi:hypothetical protein
MFYNLKIYAHTSLVTTVNSQYQSSMAKLQTLREIEESYDII